MAYSKTTWKNREVEKPRTFQIQNNPDGTVTLIPKEGNIIEAGTPIIADNMNKIEQGIADAHELASGFAEHLADEAAHGIGDKATLKTTHKASIVGAINEAFQSASDGKTAIANAVTAKGVSASPSDTFPTLATKIGQINTGKKWASGTGLRTSSGKLTVRSLGFRPNFIIANGTSNSSFAIYKDGYCITGSTTQNSVVSSGTMYVDGFDINTTFQSGTYDWIAFE